VPTTSRPWLPALPIRRTTASGLKTSCFRRNMISAYRRAVTPLRTTGDEEEDAGADDDEGEPTDDAPSTVNVVGLPAIPTARHPGTAASARSCDGLAAAEVTRPAWLRYQAQLLVQLRMLTALEITTATVTSEARDCNIMRSFAQALSGIVSVGLNAVALVNEV